MDGELVGVALVDPVPGEVRTYDRRHSGTCSSCARERRCVSNDQANVVGAEQRDLARQVGIPVGMKGRSRAGGRVCIQVKAVDLDDPGIARPRDEGEGNSDRPFEQPRRGGRTDDDGPAAGEAATERVDDFDLTRGVPEPVPRDVETYARRRTSNVG